MCRRSRRLSLLFLSTASASPALLAEAWARAMAGNALGVAAAALAAPGEPWLAGQALAEAGLSTGGLAYARLDDIQASPADLVVMLSEGTAGTPVALANGAGRIDWLLPRQDDGLAGLRRTQALLRTRVAGLIEELGLENRLAAAGASPPGLSYWPGGRIQAPAASLTAAAI
jgi:protein-tyrosine-phosphatase